MKTSKETNKQTNKQKTKQQQKRSLMEGGKISHFRFRFSKLVYTDMAFSKSNTVITELGHSTPNWEQIFLKLIATRAKPRPLDR